MTHALMALVIAALTAPTAPSPPDAALPMLPQAVQAELGRYRVAEPADFIATVRAYAATHPQAHATRGLVEADFNGDGHPDYAVLAVEPATREFRFLLAVSRADGSYAFLEKRHYRGAFPQRGGIIYTAIELKASGEDAWADKLYSKISRGTPAREAFKATPALAIWRPVGLDPYGRPDDYEVSSLAYCADVYYYAGGKLGSFMVCK